MSIFDSINKIKTGYKKGNFKDFDGTTIDLTAHEVKEKFSLITKHINKKKKDKEKVYLQCKHCGHCEEINLELFVKILGGATVGFGAVAWPTFLFAGTGFAMPLCLAIIAGGTAIASYSKELTEWFSKKYECKNCGSNKWETVTEKELVLKEVLKEKELIIQQEKAKQENYIFKRYYSVDVIDALHQLYQDAEEYIYISYGWLTPYCVKEDLPYLIDAANRGVKITVYYGIEPIKNGKTGKYTEGSLAKLKNTIEAVNYLKAALPDTATFILTDTHSKITICEKYTLSGSHNLLSYRPNEETRTEFTDKTNWKREMDADMETIQRQKARPDLELLIKNM